MTRYEKTVIRCANELEAACPIVRKATAKLLGVVSIPILGLGALAAASTWSWARWWISLLGPGVRVTRDL